MKKAKPLAKAAMAGARGLGVDGKSRPRVRRQAKRAWTRVAEDRFFEMLAESCNVLMAAEAAGVRPQRAYDRRTRDAYFRGRWDQALAAGYGQLEMMLLERALHGTEKVIVTPSGENRIIREYSDRLALALLKMHRETVSAFEAGIEEEDCNEARERIIARLERLREREQGQRAGEGAREDPSAGPSGCHLPCKSGGGEEDGR